MSARAAAGAKASAATTARRANPFISSSLSMTLLLLRAIRSHEAAGDKREPRASERMTEDKSAGWATYYEKLRDRPPRRTLLAALDRFGAPPPDALAVDLGCGDGRDVIEMLRRGWKVVAVDAEPEALRQLQARPLPAGSDVTPIVAPPGGRAAADRPQPGQFELRHAALRARGVPQRVGRASARRCRPAAASAASGMARATAGSDGRA